MKKDVNKMDGVKNPPIFIRRKGYSYTRGPEYTNHQYDYILSDIRIQSGEPCIRGTRIPVTTLYSSFKCDKYPIGKIARLYSLKPAQVKAAIAYVEGK
jgi:uncharacterized protein (DUF433 family)